MSATNLFNQTITLYSKSSYDAYGREVVGAGASVNCRFQHKTKQRLLPDGSLKTIHAIAYIPGGTTIAEDDRVTYGSDTYKVFSINNAVDGSGNINHIKLELIKWL